VKPGKRWPLAAALALLLIATAFPLLDSLRRSQGHLIYALDDPYIHMAMAKNFARHGVWGVTRHGFTSVTSSPLWTLLLSGAFALFGAHASIPLLLNLLFAALLLAAADLLLRRRQVPDHWRFPALAGTALLVPLPSLVLTGQEHILHALLTVVFAGLLLPALAESGTPRRWPLLLSAALLAAVRYENIFLIAAACLLLCLRRRFRLTLALAASAAVPVITYGLLSLAHGWFFLPTSVLMKGEATRQLFHVLHPGRSTAATAMGIVNLLGWTGLAHIVKTPHILALFVSGLALVVLRLVRRQGWSAGLALLFLITAFLHMQFARTGPLHRYEAYLIVLGIIALVTALDSPNPRLLDSLIPRLLLPVAFFLMAWPAFRVLRDTPVAAANIYEQQYQMGLFLRRFYDGRPVAANDVGAINWLADLDCLDTWGMSTIEIGRARAANRYTPELLDRLCRTRGTEIAIVHKSWLLDAKPGRVPAPWIEAGTWTIADNIVCGDSTVTFFACDSTHLPGLLANLRAFASDLPPGITQSGPYRR